MTKKQISVLSWDNALKLLSPKKRNTEFCTIISAVSEDLKKQNKNYVYFIQFEFGDKIIDSGSIISFDEYAIENKMQGVTKTLQDFKNDLSYSNDPLGMVVQNHLEVYSENDLLNSSGLKLNTYRVHLNTINEGGLFGVYGTLDYFNADESKNASDWNVLAGNSCFEILFPFENDTVISEICKPLNGNAKFLNKKIASNVEEKIKFIKQYIGTCNKDWRTGVIYFPFHYISAKNLPLNINLYKTGWDQSKSSRNFLFENKVLTDIIYSLDSTVSFKHNKHLLNLILHYIIKSSNGEAYVLKPLKDNNHILNIALEKFKEDIFSFLHKGQKFVPVILYYDKLNERDFGCIPVDSIPILLNYSQINLNNLEADLFEIRDRANNVSLPSFYATADKGSGNDRRKGRKDFEASIKSLLNLKDYKVSLTTKWLSNFIVIETKI